jgi:hypothetical protein
VKKEYSEEEESALRELEKASTNLKKAAGGKVGEVAEKIYGQAYSKCYKLGIKQWKPEVCKTTR